MRKRILVIARMSPRVNGRTRYLIEALQNRYDVDVVCEAPPRGVSAARFAGSVRLREVRLFLPGRRLWWITGAVRVAQLNLMALGMALGGRYDAVVANDAPYSIGGVIAKRLLRVPLVFNAHEIAWALGSGPALDALMRVVERQALAAADVMLAPSPTRARIALEAQRLEREVVVYENFPVLPAGPTDRAKYREALRARGVPGDKPVVLFQGTFVPRRGLESLAEAAATGAFHLVLQGFGPLRPVLEANPHPGVTLLDPCPAEETVGWTSAADFSFVYYENDCLNSAHACSSKLYTSVFADTPVFCNRLPAFEEFAREHGGVEFFESLDAGRLARTIEALAADPQRRQQLKEQMSAAHRKFEELGRSAEIESAFAGLLERAA